MKFYFTYGTEGQPFSGGWTEVIAETMRTATCAFRAYHPDKTDGLLNCSDVYTEEQFANSSMAKSGNFDRFCQEKIFMQSKKVVTLRHIGRDSWSRPVYKQEDGTLWKDVDPSEGSDLKLCTSINNAFDGEPCDPMYVMKRFEDAEIRLLPRRDTWEDPVV